MVAKMMAAGCMAVGLLAWTAKAGEYPFSDDFSNPVQTYKNWSQLPLDSQVTKVCLNGVYTVTNKQKNQSALVYHTFTEKTGTFTASCVITRGSESSTAGMWLCLTIPTAGTVTGYVVQLHPGGYISIYKDATIFGSDYPQHGLTDTVKVSKQGNTLTVFCNGICLGSCTDTKSPINSGDFGVIVGSNSTAVFDDVLFTDQYTPGGLPTSWTDKFNNGKLEGAWIAGPANNFAENDSVLIVSVPKDSDASCYVKLAVPDTFAMRGIFSWRSGDSTSLYGIHVLGDVKNNLVPMVSFGICGAQLGSIFLPNIPFTPKFSSKINGKALLLPGMTDTAFFKDTIDVVKKAGSDKLVMMVNGNRLDSVALSAVAFTVTGAGLFCKGKQCVFVDFFNFGPDMSGTKLLPLPSGAKQFKPLVFSPFHAVYLVDPLGRILRARGAHGYPGGRIPPGLYIAPNGKKGIVLKR